MLPVSAVLMLLSVCGCVFPAAVIYKVRGPQPVPALYEPAKVPTLILVENYQAQGLNRIDADRLARFIAEDLKSHDVVPVIEHDAVVEYRDQHETEFAKMSIPAVGRALGAKQVIYVNLLHSYLDSPDASEMIKGRVAVRIRVINVASSETLWPAEMTEGHPLSIETPYLRTGSDLSPEMVRARMLKAMAEEIGKVFRKWKPEDEIPD